jgi:hypothetical protein
MPGLLAMAAMVGLTCGLALAQAGDQAITGTVVSVDDANDTIVLSTDQGRRTFRLSSGFAFPQDIDENDRVLVRYRMDGSDMLLTSVNLDTTTSPTATGTTGAYTTTTSPTATGTTGTYTTTGMGTTTASDYDADADELPATASPLALIALLGLGSLTGAAALRRRRS